MNTVDNALVVSISVQARLPLLIWGPPGVGKTATVYAVADALGLPCEVVLAAIREPSDFAGLPVVRDGAVHLAAPSWAQRLAARGGVLFLDEISTAPPAVQAALLRVVLDRVVGDTTLPDTVAVLAAANPPEQAAGGWDLAPPLANRFLHYDWVVDARSWVQGMVAGFAAPAVPRLPGEWATQLPFQRALVAGFVRARPHLLLQVPEDEHQAGRAWPSPRSWDLAARAMAACAAIGAGEDLRLALVAGCVGDGVAVELMAYIRDLDLPDPEVVLAAPDRFTLPARGDQVYAVLAAVVSAALGNLTPERWTAAWAVLDRAAALGAVDVAASAAAPLARAYKPGQLPIPTAAVARFAPLLRAAGIM